jgi:spermidine synthase
MYKLPDVIDRALTKNGEIQLQKRNKNYEIIFNGTFLMATYNGNSEKLLVSSAVKTTPFPKKVLIGGLGVGFSLGEALKHDGVEHITVVEIEPAIIEWNKKYFSNFSNNGLEDPRVKVVKEDLIEWMLKTKEKYDVICLDIDNGPSWTVLEQNTRLYNSKGLEKLTELLNLNGAISFWSASKSPVFEKKLRKYFRSLKIYTAGNNSKNPDYIYVAN